jgi:antitoxin Phd
MKATADHALHCGLQETGHLTSVHSKRRDEMKAWPVQDAKARFSELLETCLREGPQLVTRRGEKAAVLVSAAQWQRLAGAGKPTLKDLLLTDSGRFDLQILPRGKARRRAPRVFA